MAAVDPIPVQEKAVPNGLPPPPFDLPYPDGPELITANLLRLTELAPDERTRFVFKSLLTHLHQFIGETSLTADEWMAAIQFLTRVGQTCTPLRQEFILLSDVLGVSALVDALGNPPATPNPAVNPGVGEGKDALRATESSVLGPFFTEDAPDVAIGASIASEGKGEYMYVEGRVLGTDGAPVPGAVIETWETDALGFYDTQYATRDAPECRGRITTDEEGRYGYRAVVPVAYPIPGDGPVGTLLLALGRHNMRPNHLHLAVTASGFAPLTTALYPAGDAWLASDAVFGVKRSLVVDLRHVEDEEEARRRGFARGAAFELLAFDIVLSTPAECAAARGAYARVHGGGAAAAAGAV